jgi:uncharacterized SAM-dependent methyltransferase
MTDCVNVARLDDRAHIIAPATSRVDDQNAAQRHDWHSRALYLGESGAQNWLRVVQEPNYPLRNPSYYDLRANRLAAVRGLAINTFVSLGPGDGQNEIELVQALASQARAKLHYIPVDISLPLLRQAIAHLSPHAEVPVAIHADFEESGQFLAHALAQYAQPPVLFALLGGTIGNLDRGEQPLIEWLRSQLRTEDRLLVDLPLAGPAWTPSERRAAAAAGRLQSRIPPLPGRSHGSR